MTNEEKLAVAVAALEGLAKACEEKPYSLDDDFDDYTHGGNFDDAVSAGERHGTWYAAEAARAALAKVRA